MAAILSRICLSKKPNTKVYNLNPIVPDFPLKKHFAPDLEHEPNREHNMNQFNNGSSKFTCNGYSELASQRNNHRNSFCKCSNIENQNVNVVENFSVDKAEETTHNINECLKVAEEMREGASKLLVNLNQQNDRVLQRGEKLLESLWGLFSRRWKPKKYREIKGPVLTKEETISRKVYYMEQRKKLGPTPSISQSNPRRFSSGSSSSHERLELEKAKQDDSLSKLSNLLGKLKAMAVEMGSQIDRQNKALDRMQDGVDELNVIMKRANHRTRHLLR